MNLNQKIKLYQALRDATEVLDEICDKSVSIYLVLSVLSDMGCGMDNDNYVQMIDFIEGQEN